MKATKTTRRVAGALVAIGLLIAGTSCSKSDTDSETTDTSAVTSTTEAEESTTTTSEASTEDDEEAAEASLITEADVPAGFDVVASTSSNSPNPFIGIAECAPYEDAIKASEDDLSAKAEIDFENAAEDKIANQVEVYTDTKVATDSADALADPGFPACVEAAFKELLAEELPAAASIDSIKAAKAEVASPDELGVDSAVAFTLDLTVSANAKTVELHMGIAMLTSGRTLSQVSTQGSVGRVEIVDTLQAAADNLKANAPS